MTSQWLTTVLLFAGWVTAGRLLIPGLGRRPILLILSGVAFSYLTSRTLAYLSAEQSTTSKEGVQSRDTNGLFRYPRRMRRLLWAGLLFWPAMLLGASAGFLSGIIDRWLFAMCLLVFGGALLLGLYLAPNVLRTIRATETGIEVHSMTGRRSVIRWDEITTMEPSRFHRHGIRVKTQSGVSLYLDDSLPGYATLTALIRSRQRSGI